MRRMLTVFLLLALAVPGAVFASGTLIYEQGAKASAQAGAFVARADDPSALFYNPAGTAFFGEGWNFAFNLTYIAPDVKYESPTLGTYKNSATNFFLPAFFVTYGLNDKVTFGFSVTAPFNLATDWSEQFPGRFVSRHSEIVSMNYHPTVAFKVHENHAFSIGLDYYHSTVKLSRKQDTSALSTAYNGLLGEFYPFPYPYDTLPVYQASEALVSTEVSDSSLGWDIGYRFNKGPWSFGLSYKSAVKFDYDGDTVFSVDGAAIGPYANYFPAQKTVLPLESIPEVIVAGLAYEGERFSTEFDLQYTGWDSWGRATATFSSPTVLVPATEEFIFDWESGYCYRLGMGYKYTDQIEFRWGVLFDEAPVPDRTRSSVLPDEDRWSLQFGMGYDRGNWGFDWYMMYLMFDDANVSADNIYRYNENGLPEVDLGSGDLYHSVYPMIPDGKYKGTTWLAGFQFNYKF